MEAVGATVVETRNYRSCPVIGKEAFQLWQIVFCRMKSGPDRQRTKRDDYTGTDLGGI